MSDLWITIEKKWVHVYKNVELNREKQLLWSELIYEDEYFHFLK